MIIKHLQSNLSPGKSIASQNRKGGTLHLSTHDYVSAAIAKMFGPRETEKIHWLSGQEVSRTHVHYRNVTNQLTRRSI